MKYVDEYDRILKEHGPYFSTSLYESGAFFPTGSPKKSATVTRRRPASFRSSSGLDLRRTMPLPSGGGLLAQFGCQTTAAMTIASPNVAMLHERPRARSHFWCGALNPRGPQPPTGIFFWGPLALFAFLAASVRHLQSDQRLTSLAAPVGAVRI